MHVQHLLTQIRLFLKNSVRIILMFMFFVNFIKIMLLVHACQKPYR